ncbi:hypothetical protein PO883_22170 [Massilia sp. DJPM01]|uniref:hypothetical protein n=1 Tax=Massilia sp. DJPM01 TaxID=3024404 RepID=UPI00259FD744|nr:hypothetical protein [Massilia sp. DJPM01]MDM5179902.1 hypothetical protein [Massilia sp. DJPM01]
MHRHWGRDYKVAQFAGGTIFEYVSGKPAAVPMLAAGSLEQRLVEQAKSVVGLTPLAPVELPQFSYEYLTSGSASSVSRSCTNSTTPCILAKCSRTARPGPTQAN